MFTSIQKKMHLSNIKFLFRSTSRREKQSASRLVNETDVSREYLEAFRTKSYIEICDKVQSHISLNINGSFSSLSSSSSSIRDHYIDHRQRDNILLEVPEKETMANIAKTFQIHILLLDFLDAGLEAWKICEKLLHSVQKAYGNHHRIKNFIKLAERVPESDHHCSTIYKELALYSSLANPLSDLISLENFPKIHNHLKLLLKRLIKNRTRINRKRKLIICFKKTMGCALIASYTVLAVALLVLAFHGLVGIVASPALITSLLGLTKKGRAAKKSLKTSELKRVCSLLDVAAKGVYALIQDFDTIGSLARRLHNEVEFGRTITRKCVGNSLRSDVLEEVMREFRVHESRFMEQQEELKDHINLCLLNVNRSRRLLVQEIML